MLRHVAADQVTLGMYIRRFEGSWFYHPFWRARFVVRTDEQLARVRRSGIAVYIDPEKGAAPPVSPTVAADSGPRPRRVSPIPPRAASPVVTFAPPPARLLARAKAPVAFGKADKARAIALAQRSTKVVKALFENCELGRAVSTAPILSVVDDIAATLEQNSSAFISVTRLRSKDDAIYTHSVAVCALMIGLAREAGYAPAAIQAMGTAGLLHDVGKVAIDDGLLNKAGQLAEAEIADIRRHPQLGHDLLSAESGLPPVALDVCIHHHERLDGSGYPFGLKGEGVSQGARMAAICDVYDAMTAGMASGKGILPSEAIAQMEADGGQFDASLLFKFMRSIGVFPTGKLVRLRSNRLAIILPNVGEDRRPLARAFYATIGSCFVPYEDVVLSDRLSDDQAVSEEDPAKWFGGDWPSICERIGRGRSPLPASADPANAKAA